jgi:hypothetical protein
VQNNVWDLDGLLCAFVQQSGMPAVSKDLACTLFEQIVESGTPSKAAVRQAVAKAEAASRSPEAASDPRSSAIQETYAEGDSASVEGLFGGSS